MSAQVASTPIDLDVLTPRTFVYRLWAADGTCLYVGQHRGIHPSQRIKQHQAGKPWWGEVARADYIEVHGNLDEAECNQISELDPKYNVVRGRSAPSRRQPRTKDVPDFSAIDEIKLQKAREIAMAKRREFYEYVEQRQEMARRLLAEQQAVRAGDR